MNQNAETIEQIEKQMIRAGAFHPDDLIFNQAGELSPRQKRWLFINLSSWLLPTGGILIILIFIWYFFYQKNNLLLFCAGSSFWSVILGLAMQVSIANVAKTWDDIKKNEVLSLTGTISKHLSVVTFPNTKEQHNGGYCSLEISDHTFNLINPIIYASIVNHQTYRLFYTPNAKKIINIEPLFHMDTEKQSALQDSARENEEKQR